MKKYKFNPYERAVGLFITFAVIGSLFVGVGMAVKKNWFEERVHYTTYIQSAANLRAGSSVFMAGLRVGKIDKIELDHLNGIKVTFTVLNEYRKQVTEGSKVEFIRPYVIGEKVLTLLQGTPDGKILAEGDVIPVNESVDLLDLLSGQKLKTTLSKVESILNSLDETMLVGRNLALQVGDEKKLKETLDNLNFASHEVRKILPHLTSNAPSATKHMAKTIENLSVITTDLRTLQPEGAEKTVEFLTETLITLKGLQKSFLLRSNIEEVKKEMALQEKQKLENRAPASK